LRAEEEIDRSAALFEIPVPVRSKWRQPRASKGATATRLLFWGFRKPRPCPAGCSRGYSGCHR